MEKAYQEEQKAIKYCQWQQNRHIEQYDEACKFWENLCLSKTEEIVSLENKILALQEQMQPGNKKEEELKDTLILMEDQLQQYLLENVGLHDEAMLKDQQIKQVKKEYKQQLSLIHETHRKSLEEERQKYDVIAHMNDDFERKLLKQQKKAQSALKEQVEKYNNDTTILKKQINDMKVSNENVMDKLEKELKEKEEMIKKQKNTQASADFQHLIQCKNLEMKLTEKEKKITELKGQSKLNITVAKLKVALTVKSAVMDSKNREIDHLKKDKRDMQDKWKTEEASNAILLLKIDEMKEINARLEEELAEEVDKLKENAMDLTHSRRLNSDQADTITRLQYKVRASEPDLKKMTAKVRKLETYKLRFQEDLQTCVSVIGEPKKLKSEVLRLKNRYLDNDKIDKMDQIPKGAYQHQVKCLKTMKDRSDQIKENHSSELKKKEMILYNASLKMDKTRRNFIKVLNEKSVEVHELKEELKEKTEQLNKANKPAQEKVRSWIKKKVLRKSQVAPKVAGELPLLYPDTWQPLGHPDDDIPSSSCTWNTPTSDTVCTTRHVQLFVDDGGMTPVDI